MSEQASPLSLMLDPVIRCSSIESARKLVDVRVDPAVQERVSVLAGKANEGLLTQDERAEYESYIDANTFISILKLKARRHLRDDGCPDGVGSHRTENNKRD